MHRKDMIDVFLRHLPPSCTLHTSKRLVKYTQVDERSPIVLHFADGTTAEADLLVGADGVHSATRRCMYDDVHQKECTGTRSESEDTPVEKCARCAASRPTWAGIYAYRFLIPTERLYALNPHHTTATIGAILCVSAGVDMKERS